MPLTIATPDTDNHTPCYSSDPDERRELSALFDSTDLIDHREARRLCEECPFLEGCGRLAVSIARGPASWAGVPSGTWGGALFRGGKPATVSTRRTA